MLDCSPRPPILGGIGEIGVRKSPVLEKRSILYPPPCEGGLGDLLRGTGGGLGDLGGKLFLSVAIALDFAKSQF
ncbi:MAG: hypothetical protein J7647_24640 [Cyanobacteria bacterium SBLK]|nr:hypothetical protein [Cyanobacteria bacterium SBLK]